MPAWVVEDDEDEDEWESFEEDETPGPFGERCPNGECDHFRRLHDEVGVCKGCGRVCGPAAQEAWKVDCFDCREGRHKTCDKEKMAFCECRTLRKHKKVKA